MERNVVPIDVTWLYQGSTCTPRVKLSSYGLSMWMSFHHMVLRLSPRACVAAFLKWFIDGLAIFEDTMMSRTILPEGATVSDKITGIDFISSLPPPAGGGRRPTIPFFHPRTQWMVILTDNASAEHLDAVLNNFNFALPVANLGVFPAFVLFGPGLRSGNRDPNEAAFVRSVGVFTPQPSQAVALRADPPTFYKVTLKISGLSTLLDIYGAFLGRHIAIDQQQSAILVGLSNLFRMSTELNLLTNPGLHSIEVDTSTMSNLRTDGRWIAWAFSEQEQARTFAQGLQFIMTHQQTKEQIDAARAQYQAGRGLRWSPFVAFWGTGCCNWLRCNSSSIQLELTRVAGRMSQPLPVAGQHIIGTCRGYLIERPQIAMGNSDAGETADRKGAAVGGRGGDLAVPPGAMVAAGAASNGARNDKRMRDNGGSEHEEGEVSDTGEGGAEDSMND